MKKFTKIIAGVTATILALGIAGCSKDTDYPDFINTNLDGFQQEETTEKYVINVTSEGGLKLDGVIVDAYNQNGQRVKRGMSSNGRIDLGVALGEYTLRVDPDSLPAGYSVNTAETYVTNPEKRDEVNIKLPSSLLPSNSSVNTFRVGQVMKDITFTDCDGVKYKISDLLKTKKAVVLNFWYVNCTWCRQEFPALERAYESARNNIEVLAVCSTIYGDSNASIKTFKQENGLQMPMGLDDIGLCTAFGVSGYPTTAIIDRYGLIAMVHDSAELNSAVWSSTFNKYASDDYVQEVNATGGGQSSAGREKPDVVMPISSEIEAAVNGAGCNATYRAETDDEYSWPWLIKDDGKGKYIYSSNKGKGNSYAIITADIEMEANQVLSFDYMVSSEAGRDLLYVLVNGDIVNGGGWSATGDDWKQADVYVSEKKEKVELAFIYQKDDADPDQSDPEAPRIGDDEARIRDIHLYDVAGIERPTDIMRACASGEITADRKYSHYVTPVYSEADGLYHKDSKDGPIIYMTISQFTPWSNLHTGNITDGNDYYNTLYNMTYFGYHTGEGSSFNVVLDGTNITDRLISYWTIQRYMESPFYLLPVNEQLKEWAEKFAIQYERDAGNTAHNNEWLEFCYYYQHYGNAHEEGETCKSNTDLTFGLTPYNSFTAYEKSDPARLTAKTYNEDTNRFRVDVRYPFERNNGNYYKFTATKAGVYQLRSYTTNCSTQNAVPDIAVYEKNGERYRMILSGGFVRDFDRVKGTANYEGFNEYISLEAGQEVYMLLLSSPSETSYYEFDIEYLGESLSKLFICSTGDGAWSFHVSEDDEPVGEQYYLGIQYAYDSATKRYYKALPNGEPDFTKPIYIDMVHGSFLYSDLVFEDEESNFAPLSYLLDQGYFKKLKFGQQRHKDLMDALTASTQVPKDDEFYGLVPATDEIVETLNAFIDRYVDGGMGEGNGWLTFACYMEHFGV